MDLVQQIIEDIFSIQFYADKMLPFSFTIFSLCDYSQQNRQALIAGWKVQPLVSFIESFIAVTLVRQFLFYAEGDGCEFENKKWPNQFGCKQWYQQTAKPFYYPPHLAAWHSELLPSERKKERKKMRPVSWVVDLKLNK